MANPVHASVGTASRYDGSATSITVSNPSGLTAGDEMCLFVTMYETGSSKSIQTPAGWTGVYNDTADNVSRACFMKTATAGDVSAGSVTISSTGGSDYMSASIHRITGAVPHTISIFSEVDDSTFTPSATLTTSLTPVASESLVLMYFHGGDNALSAAPTASGYTSTPSVTFTEACDIGIKGGGTDGIAHAVAYGDYDGTSTITSRGVTFSETVTRGACGGIIVIYSTPQNASGTATLLQGTPTFPAPTSGGGTSGTATLLTTTPSVQAPTSEVITPNESNAPKTTAQNIINTSKS